MARLSKTRVLVLDVDGVMTNNQLIYDAQGDDQHVFDVRDGHGLILLRTQGIVLAAITGRGAVSVHKRLTEIKFNHIVERAWKKGTALRALCSEHGYSLDEVCYVGDDINDIGAVKAAAVGVAVSDAHPDLRSRADWITEHPGGRGAVREVAEAILRAKRLWDPLIEAFDAD